MSAAEIGVDSMMACSDACGNSIATVKEFGPISSVLDEEAIALTSDIEGNLTGERGGPLAGNLSILSKGKWWWVATSFLYRKWKCDGRATSPFCLNGKGVVI